MCLAEVLFNSNFDNIDAPPHYNLSTQVSVRKIVTYLLPPFPLLLSHLLVHYNSKQKGMTLVFHSQPIINKGETLHYIYKLVKGTASILDAQGNPGLFLRPPTYLNLPEVVYQSPSCKTVRAEGRCEVLKVKVKEIHKRVIRSLKEAGMRKGCFPVFETVPSAHFYSLTQHATTQAIEKGKTLPTNKGHFYLIVEGSVFVCKEEKSKLLRLQQGETLMMAETDSWLLAQGEGARVALVSVTIAELLLAQHYQKIKRHGQNQRDLLASYDSRNSRLTADLKRRETPPKQPLHQGQFSNKIAAKVERFETYKRARSCFSVCRLDRDEILSKNQRKYLQLVDQNKKKFAKQRVYRKKLDAARHAHVLNHTKSKSLCQEIENLSTLNQSHHSSDVCLFQNFTLKSHYAALKHQPQLLKPKKQGLVRKTLNLKQGFTSQYGSRRTSISRPSP